jgi:NTP pyrophosphatase (non-canonical NTP hydrolase)
VILRANTRPPMVTFFDVFMDAAKTAADKGWDTPAATFGEAVALLHSELSEALEGYRKTGKVDDHVLEELADVVIRLGHLVGKEGLGRVEDFVKAMLRKLAKNKTRSRRHGGKVL